MVSTWKGQVLMKVSLRSTVLTLPMGYTLDTPTTIGMNSKGTVSSVPMETEGTDLCTRESVLTLGGRA